MRETRSLSFPIVGSCDGPHRVDAARNKVPAVWGVERNEGRLR